MQPCGYPLTYPGCSILLHVHTCRGRTFWQAEAKAAQCRQALASIKVAVELAMAEGSRATLDRHLQVGLQCWPRIQSGGSKHVGVGSRGKQRRGASSLKTAQGPQDEKRNLELSDMSCQATRGA